MPSGFRLRAPIVLPCDPDCSVLRDAVVDVDGGGRISYRGPAAQAPEGPERVVSLPGILLPGMDLWEEMWLAALLARLSTMDFAVPGEQVVEGGEPTMVDRAAVQAAAGAVSRHLL